MRIKDGLDFLLTDEGGKCGIIFLFRVKKERKSGRVVTVCLWMEHIHTGESGLHTMHADLGSNTNIKNNNVLVEFASISNKDRETYIFG